MPGASSNATHTSRLCAKLSAPEAGAGQAQRASGSEDPQLASSSRRGKRPVAGRRAALGQLVASQVEAAQGPQAAESPEAARALGQAVVGQVELGQPAWRPGQRPGRHTVVGGHQGLQARAALCIGPACCRRGAAVGPHGRSAPGWQPRGSQLAVLRAAVGAGPAGHPAGPRSTPSGCDCAQMLTGQGAGQASGTAASWLWDRSRYSRRCSLLTGERTVASGLGIQSGGPRWML